jgi:heptaprenyl diphosphate synthase
MLYALRDPGPEAARLRELLVGPIEEDDAVAEALALLRASPGMTKAKHSLHAYAEQARQELALLPDVPGRQALQTLVDYTISRHG